MRMFPTPQRGLSPANIEVTFSFLKVTSTLLKEPFRLVKGSFTNVPMAGTITNTQPVKQFVLNTRVHTRAHL